MPIRIIVVGPAASRQNVGISSHVSHSGAVCVGEQQNLPPSGPGFSPTQGGPGSAVQASGVPRDGSATKTRLLAVGQRLFATEGVYSVPLSKVVDGAGQRNPSVLHYHFGGRDGLLFAILDIHNQGIEREREILLDAVKASPSPDPLRALVEAVVLPMSRKLQSPDGSEFLAIVAQLDDLFDLWDRDEEKTPTQALRAFRSIAEELDTALSALVRRERVTRFLSLTTEALGARARAVMGGRVPALNEDEYVENLIAMAVGALQA